MERRRLGMERLLRLSEARVLEIEVEAEGKMMDDGSIGGLGDGGGISVGVFERAV